MKKILAYYKQVLTPPYHRSDIPAFVLIVVLLTITFISINNLQTKDTNYQSHAQSVSNTLEPESGTFTGNINVVNDPNASGGKYIMFGQLSPTPSTNPTPSGNPQPVGQASG